MVDSNFFKLEFTLCKAEQLLQGNFIGKEF